NERSRSFGVALSSCTVPAAGTPTFELGEDEMELGIGIHGEPGRERVKIGTATEIVDASLSAIDADMPLSGSEVLVLVNGMGGTPLIEQYIAYAAAAEWLEGHGATVVRRLVG
ncbi:dihydroxyacetone kinase, partial [Micromonospora aurantiaca]|nr:dihydroxyacetone kinase [Micromonospora aurantiaca]